MVMKVKSGISLTSLSCPQCPFCKLFGMTLQDINLVSNIPSPTMGGGPLGLLWAQPILPVYRKWLDSLWEYMIGSQPVTGWGHGYQRQPRALWRFRVFIVQQSGG